jgi:uncharacterized protein
VRRPLLAHVTRHVSLDNHWRRTHSLNMARVIYKKDFEWEDTKEALNIKNHGVDFEEASTAFADPKQVVLPSTHHGREVRFDLIGFSATARLLFVVHCESVGGRYSIISARVAERKEAVEYSMHNSSRKRKR